MGTHISGCLIVKDEQDRLRDCLASLEPFCDEIVVVDTGSTDGTRELARDSGAKLFEVAWERDFALARNKAISFTAGDWVLSLDADQRLEGSPLELRKMLAHADHINVYSLVMKADCAEEIGGSYEIDIQRLFRPSLVHWEGKVHEYLTSRGTVRMCSSAVPSGIIQILDRSYSDLEVVKAKGRRNADLAREGIARSAGSGDLNTTSMAHSYFQLGRSLVTVGDLDGARDSFRKVRAYGDSGRRFEATDFLARLELSVGNFTSVLSLVEEMRLGGVNPQYCDWLGAQALAPLGEVRQAHLLIAPLNQVTDAGGRRLGISRLIEMKALIALLDGCVEEATRYLVEAVFLYCRYEECARLLAEVVEGLEQDRKESIAREVLEGRWADVRAVLASHPDVGKTLSRLLGDVEPILQSVPTA